MESKPQNWLWYANNSSSIAGTFLFATAVYLFLSVIKIGLVGSIEFSYVALLVCMACLFKIIESVFLRRALGEQTHGTSNQA